MSLLHKALTILSLALSIVACSNAETPDSDFSMDFPDWKKKKSNDKLNVVSMTSPDRQCYFDLNVAPAPPDKYREIVGDFMEGQGAKILTDDPLSYEFDTQDGKYTFLAKTNSKFCGRKTQLATVTCVKDGYDNAQASRIFASMGCGGTNAPGVVAQLQEQGQTSTDTGSSSGVVEVSTTALNPDSPGPKLGMVVSPQGKFNHENVTKAFNLARQSGAEITRHYISWPDVEKGKGKYKWKGNDYMIGRAREAGLRLSVAFHVIRTAIRGPRPAGLDSLEWQDPELIERFSDMVVAFLDRYEDTVDYVEVGSEVNAYFKNHEDEIEPYRVFFTAVRNNIKAKYPNVSVGIVFAYRQLKESNNFAIYNRLNIGDHDGFTLYTTGDDFAHTKDPKLVFDALNEIAQLTGDRRFALEEVGWTASQSLGGSDESQREAVKYFFDFLEQAPDRLEFISWFNLHDGRDKDCARIAKSFSRQGDGLSRNPDKMKLFSDFLCHFGLRKNDGTPRPAWDEWVQRAEAHQSH
jgi:hypothetical protein